MTKEGVLCLLFFPYKKVADRFDELLKNFSKIVCLSNKVVY